MVITSNITSSQPLHQLAGFPLRTKIFDIEDMHGIADTGAALVFLKEGVLIPNNKPATNPLTVNLPDGRQVRLTHTCDVVVPGLPHLLVGYIVPHLTIASLYGIRPLCNVGCVVVFQKDRVDVWYDGKIILVGPRNMSTDLWTLPFIDHTCDTTISAAIPKQDVHTHHAIALFTNSVQSRMNAIWFAQQLLGNPRIFTLLKAVRHGFLHGCPNRSKNLISKYLNPSPATAATTRYLQHDTKRCATGNPGHQRCSTTSRQGYTNRTCPASIINCI
jgi:hypothetical protein